MAPSRCPLPPWSADPGCTSSPTASHPLGHVSFPSHSAGASLLNLLVCWLNVYLAVKPTEFIITWPAAGLWIKSKLKSGSEFIHRSSLRFDILCWVRGHSVFSHTFRLKWKLLVLFCSSKDWIMFRNLKHTVESPALTHLTRPLCTSLWHHTSHVTNRK